MWGSCRTRDSTARLRWATQSFDNPLDVDCLGADVHLLGAVFAQFLQTLFLLRRSRHGQLLNASFSQSLDSALHGSFLNHLLIG